MPSAQERIREAVGAIQGWLAHIPNPGEAVVRQAIVLRLLHAAGFDIWNPAEVVPEETDKGGFRPDLRVQRGKGQFVLELKGMNVGLHDKDYQQVASYAGGKGIRWALITDGRLWIVLDEHLTGPYSNRIVLKIELSESNASATNELVALLDPATWAMDRVQAVLDTIRVQQEQRRNEAQILREKRPLVEQFQKENEIGSFEKAAQLFTQLGKITESERDVLLDVAPTIPLNREAPPRAEQKTALTQPLSRQKKKLPSGLKLRFSYRVEGAEAHAMYCPSDGTWTILAGSTAIAATKPYANTILQQRTEMLSDGRLQELSPDMLCYASDVIYPSASAAAGHISGGSKNGWDVWKDDQGRPAQHYRPTSD